ncbi:MAG TPA: cellulase family glycosylhydrolase [Actinophytocola sp.]|uniref:cellulase family glycosylhydrolase n=1 Tax=Actinophytocola sp. TaxID=1872138 RepID=UPI002DDCF9DC|nr:cellulase family glycosylhydrolase [Actinophytocola sp.]HEV2784351.1 cellulase family glycosylhydrolase [Actinophytocola sp.]
MRSRTLRVSLPVAAVAGVVVGLIAPTPTAAAPTRYEAESATISQGVVESNHAGFSGTGFVNYDNLTGSFVEFSVSTTQAGPATLTFRYANGTTADRPLTVTVNGSTAAASLSFPGTGAWTAWQSRTITANLNAGSNTVRAAATTANGGPNLDYLDVDVAAPAAEYQAESATITQGVVESNHAGFTGTGFVNYDNVVGSSVQFTVSGSGPATLIFRYANGTTTDRPMSIAVNGTVVAPGLSFPGTGAWTTWQTRVITANLNAGSNTIRATATTANGGPNLDKIDIGPGDEGQPPTVPTNLTVTGTTSSSISLSWTASTDDVGVVGYRVYEGSAVVASPAGTSATIGGLAPSTSHTYAVSALDAAGNESARSAPVTGTTRPAATGTPVAINGQLHVCGTKLCNQHNQPIQLRGMSTHGLQWYRQCVNNASLDALATNWTADVLRISMYIQEDGYETNPRFFTDLVHQIIEQVTARGMYAIVDWHMLDPGDPNFNLSRARTFFTEIAQRHNGKNNLLYEIANEPNGVTWSTVRSYAEQLIPVIRQNDPDTPILVGTRAWSSLGVSDGASETEVINNPVRAGNIMYTFHFYAASHGTEYLNTLSRAADRIPMFVTEFGTQTASGDGGNNFTRAQQYLDLMASKKISWVNWNYSDDFRSGAVFREGTCPNGPYTGTGPLKPAGVWVRDRINTPDNFPTG